MVSKKEQEYNILLGNMMDNVEYRKELGNIYNKVFYMVMDGINYKRNDRDGIKDKMMSFNTSDYIGYNIKKEQFYIEPKKNDEIDMYIENHVVSLYIKGKTDTELDVLIKFIDDTTVNVKLNTKNVDNIIGSGYKCEVDIETNLKLYVLGETILLLNRDNEDYAKLIDFNKDMKKFKDDLKYKTVCKQTCEESEKIYYGIEDNKFYIYLGEYSKDEYKMVKVQRGKNKDGYDIEKRVKKVHAYAVMSPELTYFEVYENNEKFNSKDYKRIDVKNVKRVIKHAIIIDYYENVYALGIKRINTYESIVEDYSVYEREILASLCTNDDSLIVEYRNRIKTEYKKYQDTLNITKDIMDVIESGTKHNRIKNITDDDFSFLISSDNTMYNICIHSRGSVINGLYKENEPIETKEEITLDYYLRYGGLLGLQIEDAEKYTKERKIGIQIDKELALKIFYEKHKIKNLVYIVKGKTIRLKYDRYTID